jgi:O-antigen ligase
MLGFVNQAGVGTIDSYFLLILLEYGVAGFLLFFGLFLVGIWQAGRALLETRVTSWETSLLAPLVIALGTWIIIKSVFAQPDNNPLIFAMLGMTSALAWRARQMALCQSQPLPHDVIRQTVPLHAG